jgi:hypothetical protein
MKKRKGGDRRDIIVEMVNRPDEMKMELPYATGPIKMEMDK